MHTVRNIIQFIIFFVAITPCCLLSCTCDTPAPPAEAFSEAALVFSGQVVKITLIEIEFLDYGILPFYAIEFELYESWKTHPSQVLAIVTSKYDAMCGYPFQLGQDYLVYARVNEDFAYVILCSRTNLLSKAEEDLVYLRSLGSNPLDFNINQNHPNPFLGQRGTTFRCDIPFQTVVSLTIYNIVGREVIKILDDTRDVGSFTIDWRGTDEAGKQVESGLYFAVFEAPGYRRAIKMVLLR